MGVAMTTEQRAMLDTLGVRASRITTAVDVMQFLDRKRRAMEVHASQIADTSFFLAMPEDVFGLVWGTEWDIRFGSEPTDHLEDSLLDRPAGETDLRYCRTRSMTITTPRRSWPGRGRPCWRSSTTCPPAGAA